MHFWHSCQKNYDKSQFFVVQNKTMIQKVENFCKNLIFFKFFFWRCRVRFWQNHGKSFEKNWKSFFSKSEKDRKLGSLRNCVSLKCWCVHEGCSFNHPVKNFGLLARKAFGLYPIKWKDIIFQDKYFPQNVCVDT